MVIECPNLVIGGRCGKPGFFGNQTSKGLYQERFQAKWKPVRVKKTRQNKNLEPRFDAIGTEMAL
jgi:hypothetical protein